MTENRLRDFSVKNLAMTDGPPQIRKAIRGEYNNYNLMIYNKFIFVLILEFIHNNFKFKNIIYDNKDIS